MELLAPAGNWEAMRAAVENGADAVYLGGNRFSARAQADNFALDEIERAVHHCHLRRVKVYAAVNTLLHYNELDDCLQYVETLHELGADAIIVQDLGLAGLLHKSMPHVSLHASTQMFLHSVSDVKAAQRLGIERVVLPRELTLAEIGAIRRETGIEVEVFVHGSLCIAYSGQCLFSSVVGGRSGNRGQCAQPCRLPMDLVAAVGEKAAHKQFQGPYGISPKDRCFLRHLEELRAVPVTALKIEGRMKRPEYTGVVVRAYRDAIDGGSGDLRSVSRVFQRGFTTAPTFAPADADFIRSQSPKQQGWPVGAIREVRDKRVKICFSEPLQPDDGIEIPTASGGSIGYVLHQRAAAGECRWLDVRGAAAPGAVVFQTKDAALLREASASIRQYRRRIAVHLFAAVAPGQPLRITVVDEDGISATAASAQVAQTAHTRPISEERWRQQLLRLGDWPVDVVQLEVEFQGEPVLPWSVINQCRHAAMVNWQAQRLRAQLPQGHGRPAASGLPAAKRLSAPVAEQSSQPLVDAAVCTLEQLEAVLAAGAGRVTFFGPVFEPGRGSLAADFRRGLALAAKAGIPFFAGIDRIARRSQWPAIWEILDIPGLQGICAGNIGVLTAAKGQCRQRPAVADWSCNVYQAAAITQYQEFGAGAVYLSPELNRSQIRAAAAASPLPLGILVQGRIPLMVSDYCPLRPPRGRSCARACRRQYPLYFQDRRKFLFPIAFDNNCRMHLFNTKELSLLPWLTELYGIVSLIRIDARMMTADTGEGWVRRYRQFLAGESVDSEFCRGQQFTAGHYLRGVQ